MNSFIDDKNKDAVKRLRERFMNELEANPELYHPIDVERVRSENWQIERFLLDRTERTDTEEEAYQQLIGVLQWKRATGLHDRNDEYFPREFYHIFNHEKYSRDQNGRLVVWFCENQYRKVADISPIIQQFLSHQLEKQDRVAGSAGWITISDCSGSGMANVDMSMSRYRVDQLVNYPHGVRQSLNVDMPWILNSVLKVVKNFMSKSIRDQLILVRRQELTNFVDIVSIPQCFGGKRECSLDGLKRLDQFKPLYECKHLGLNNQQIDAFYSTYKNLFQK